MYTLEENSSNPLYIQIKNIFIKEFNKIEKNKPSNLIDKNDKIPTERNLAKFFNVSRITIRQALEILKKENYILSKQGKGTFYNRNKIIKPIKESKSFSKIVIDSGHMPGAKLISASIELSNPLDRISFNISENDYVLVMKRLRFVDNIPCAYEISHFNNQFFDLRDFDFNNKSIYKFLEDEKGIKFSILEKTIEIVYSDKEISKILNIKELTPIVLMKAIMINQNNDITHIVYEYLLSDKFIFTLS